MSTDTGTKGLLQLSSCAEEQRVLGTVWGLRARGVRVPESQEGWVAFRSCSKPGPLHSSWWNLVCYHHSTSGLNLGEPACQLWA